MPPLLYFFRGKCHNFCIFATPRAYGLWYYIVFEAKR